MAQAARSRFVVLGCALVALSLAAAGHAQQQVYRYTDADGRVVYSDRPPGGTAKDVQPKRLGPNFIENDSMSLAARNAAASYPVTLYTFACGEICQSAEALLNRRGVPFSQVNVEDVQGAEKLKALTGEMTAPVLQVGDKLVAKGYNETRWHALLDEAGYPKTAAPRRTAPGKAPEPPPAPVKQAQPVPVPPPGGGYPAN